MKRFLAILALAAPVALTCALPAMAGNDTKRGQAGASEILINPFSRSTGWNGANTGNCRGIESMMLNIAGLAYVNKTDFVLSTQRYLAGTGIQINALGFAQRVSPTGVFGIQLMGMSLGKDFIETTYDLPQGTGQTFTPQFFNMGLGYAKTFSRSITGGLLLKGVYESISNVSAFGFTIDVGIQYQTGKNNEFKFGVALRNIGPKMLYSGNGLTYRGQRDATFLTVESRSSPFGMPSLLNIGASYDINVPEQMLRITPAVTFVSNSYTKDQILPGVEIAFREMFMLRTGYQLKQDFLSSGTVRTDAYTGLAAGASIQLPLAKMMGATEVDGDELAPADPTEPKKEARKTTLGFDYSYRPTNPYNGTHSLGLVLSL